MKLRNIFDSIVTRLLLMATCLVLIGAVSRYYALTDFLQKDIFKVVESQQLSLANYVAYDIDDKITQRRSLLERLAASVPIALLGKPEQLRAWIKERYEYQALFSAGLFVVNPKGIAVADYPVLANRVRTDYSDRDYIQAGLRGETYVGRPVMGRAAKEPVLPLAAPVKDARGEVRAVLAGITTLAAPGFLNSLLRSRIGSSSGGFLLVSPRDSVFVASSQPEMVLRPTPPPGVNALHDKAMGGYRGTGITVNSAGVEEISAIVSVPSTDWFVVARLPTREALATVQRTQDFLARGAVLTMLAFAVLGTLGLYYLLRHLFRAAEHADRMTLGELPLEPLPIARNDEIGHLIAAFNRLLAKLNDKQNQLSVMAHHDTLTGLPNRTLLYDRLQQVLAQARREHAEIAVLYMDLDGFKHINDTLGHQAGDVALKQVAGRLSGLVRDTDTLARVGGDEFVLVLSALGPHPAEGAVIVASKCIDALKQGLAVAGRECTVGVSIGIVIGKGSNTPDSFLVRADQAMYEAKKAGRGRYVTARL